MSLRKSIISLVLLCSLAFSLMGGITPAYATESDDFSIGDDFAEDVTDNSASAPLTPAEEDSSVDDPLHENSQQTEAGKTGETEEQQESDTANELNTSEEPPEKELDLVEQFVDRMYWKVLERGYDEDGFNSWVNSLKSGRITGARAAHGFFFSDEFIAYNRTNEEFVDLLYEALMGRAPDEGGKASWMRVINLGWPREDIFAGFVNSTEFTNLCKDYGITRGTYTAPPGRMARVFATRLYRTVLDREPDLAGLNSWHNALRTGRITGARAAHGFLFSAEIVSKNLEPEEFVELLYESMLGRKSDAAGKASWVNFMRSGASRERVFAGFVNSTEFERICRNHGIVRGTYTPPRQSPDAMTRAFVTRLYREVRGIEPDRTGLNNRTNSLINRRSTAATVAHEFFFSREMRARSNTDFVNALFVALLGRNPTKNEVDSRVARLGRGASRTDLFLDTIYEHEFDQICRFIGIRALTSDQYQGRVIPFNHFGTRAGCTAVVTQGLRHIGYHGRPNMFTRYAGLTGDWCAMFTNYVFDHTGSCSAHSGAQHSGAKIRSWSCTTIMRTAVHQGRWADGNFREPAPGDWILFNWGNGQPWTVAQHVGIVTGHDGVTVYYVDGNVSGNQVLHQSVPITSGVIRGYVRMF